MMLRRLLRTAAIVTSLAMMAACGIKGPLFLPPKATPEPLAPPASATSAPPASAVPAPPGGAGHGADAPASHSPPVAAPAADRKP